ncbi:MAG: hypothetical protein WA182_04280 [Candidatus Sulfotelmatobacter sp.]
MKYCLAFVLLLASLAAAATGTISGTVVDVRGVPEKHLVLSYVEIGVPLMGAIPQTETDQNGHFSIKIVVKHEEDGTISGGRWAVYPHYDPVGGTGYYPPNRIRFYRTEHSYAQEIDVTPEAPDAVVEIKLGPKAGAIAGKVTDALTGAPIKPYAEIVVAWAAEQATVMGTHTELAGWIDPGTGQWIYHGTIQGKYRILVPPDTELTLKATAIAKGYKPYQYPGVITVGSGQDKVLDIQLQPEDK